MKRSRLLGVPYRDMSRSTQEIAGYVAVLARANGRSALLADVGARSGRR